MHGVCSACAVFTIADKAEPNWQADVVEDVTGEAAKFGQVLHCFPDPNSMNVSGQEVFDLENNRSRLIPASVRQSQNALCCI